MAVQEMLDGYVEAALWSDIDTGDGPYNLTKELSPAAKTRMRQDVQSFYERNAADIGGDFSRAGIDFWRTRNRHGAGFWDGDWPEPAASRLTESAHAFGEQDIYVGADGMLHVSGEHAMLAGVFPEMNHLKYPSPLVVGTCVAVGAGVYYLLYLATKKD